MREERNNHLMENEGWQAASDKDGHGSRSLTLGKHTSTFSPRGFDSVLERVLAIRWYVREREATATVSLNAVAHTIGRKDSSRMVKTREKDKKYTHSTVDRARDLRLLSRALIVLEFFLSFFSVFHLRSEMGRSSGTYAHRTQHLSRWRIKRRRSRSTNVHTHTLTQGILT